jgi:glycosyltransferase involved in cell wall biosynthesis
MELHLINFLDIPQKNNIIFIGSRAKYKNFFYAVNLLQRLPQFKLQIIVGGPPIEAQAVGRSVLTSNIEPMIEIAGDGALFVNPYDVNEIRAGFFQ